ncbi:MAG: NADH-quinone oxidoreductase subunit NuoH [Actinobacteria bacterium]|nr:NADH-quinone oxidoreductase subunit NuoH [Actinomycetota bacterium]
MVWWIEFLWSLLKLVIAFAFLLITALILIWMLRKVMGHMQYRRGPLHHGPHGTFQTIFDTIKLLGKEDIIPAGVDRWTFIWAPIIVFIPTLTIFAFIPFAEKITATNIEISLFFVLAVMGLSILSLLMAGWGSNNKYALLGGLRSAAQMMSYEIPMIISTMGVVLMAGSMNLTEIVRAQRYVWYAVPQIIGFFIFFTASLAEINSTPFDIPEAESEIVAGFNVEYSGFRFAAFFLAEFVNLFIVCALAALLFLGGWLPFTDPVWGTAIFLVKTYVLIFIAMWIRSTFPRFRLDQFMDFGWKVLLPLSLVNLFVTAVIVLMVDKIRSV